MQKKILFFTRNSNYFLNDLNNINFFSKINQDYKCTFYFTGKVNKIFENKKIFFIKKRFRKILWTIVTILVNDLSLKRATPKSLHVEIDNFCFHTQNDKLLFIINIIRKTKIEFFIIKFIVLLLKKTNEFKNNEKEKDLFLIYDGALSLESFDIIDYANQNKKKSILIINNWDHSAKCNVIDPTLILCWGKRSEDIIKKNFNLRCKAIGTPRLEHVFRKKKKKKNKKRNKKFIKILFAGSVIPQDDFSLLKKIDTHINNKNYKVKIIFRPHPFGFFKKNLSSVQKIIREYKLKNIKFDINLLKHKDIIKRLNYSTLSKMDGLICAFSTLALECAIYNLPCLCYAINDERDGYNKLVNHEISNKYAEHLLLLNKYNWPIKSFGKKFFLEKFDALIADIISNNNNNNKIIKYILKQEVEYSNVEYYRRLKKQIDYI